jgi:16S rRNA processing protein RimM
LHTDFPERFADLGRLFLLAPDGKRQELELEEHWQHKGHVILKFRGVDSIGDAEALAGSEVQIRAGDRSKLEAGAEYVSDLVGCMVISLSPAPMEIGRIEEVQFGAGEAPLLVVKPEQEKKEILLPFAAEYLKKVDVAAKRIEMVLPKGMLELDAPLSKEEKERQARGN